jgi:hypothetical protein
VTEGASRLEWRLTAVLSPEALAARAPGPPRPADAVIATQGSVLALAPLHLNPGNYVVRLIASNASGDQSPAQEAPVQLVLAEPGGSVRVFPNPWRTDRHPQPLVTFDHLSDDSTVQIFTLSGQFVKKLRAAGSAASWDLTNDAADRVGSGIYLYSVTNGLGRVARGKLAILR